MLSSREKEREKKQQCSVCIRILNSSFATLTNALLLMLLYLLFFLFFYFVHHKKFAFIPYLTFQTRDDKYFVFVYYFVFSKLFFLLSKQSILSVRHMSAYNNSIYFVPCILQFMISFMMNAWKSLHAKKIETICFGMLDESCDI